MRAALISITGQPRDRAGDELRVAGKTIAVRQVEFARAAGCDRIIALGDGASAAAVSLRRAAEDAGAAFQIVASSHALQAAVGQDDELLVIAPGLLADEHAGSTALEGGSIVLVISAASAVPAGFERIDLELAWAGVALVSGGLVGKLSELPADFDAVSALLRIALQSRVPEHRLPERAMTDGSWVIVKDDSDVVEVGQAWLDRRLRARASEGISPWLAGELLGLSAGWLLRHRHSFALIASAATLLLVGALAAAWWGYTAAGFALVMIAAFAIEIATGMIPLLETRRQARKRKLVSLLSAIVDFAIFGCAVLELEGEWLHRLFPPVVLMLALHLRVPPIWPDAVRVLSDRVILSAILAMATAFHGTEAAVMGLSLAMLLLKTARLGGSKG